jgi:tRNA G18 (ribose-2'-O)-methylase SpoU
MPTEWISGGSDPRLEPYRGVSDPELLRSRNLFIAEGRLVVRRVIESGRYQIRSVMVNEAAYRDLTSALARLDSAVPIYVCETSAFLDFTGINIHRGCLALIERPPASSLDDVLAGASTIVVLEGVANAENVGAVFRNAAAFDADAVVLSHTSCDPLYRKAIRTSMGAALAVPFARAEWPAACARVRSAGFTLVALTPRQPSEPLDAFAGRQKPPRLALVVGSEGPGLTPDAEAAADHRVCIPTSDRVDSLNLGVAVGIALYRLRGAGLGTQRMPRTQG